jgi:DNA repair exonuclease SbcCD ATPase subunit
LEKLSEALTKAETEIDEQLDTVRRRRGALEGRIAAIAAAREQLDVGVGLCPVCRRPLSPDDLEHAVSAHEDELEQLRAELANLGEAEILDRRNIVQAGFRRLSKLSVVEEQEFSGEPLENAQTHHAASITELAEARELLVQRRAESMAIATELKTAESDSRATELLESRFKSLGRVIVAIDTLDTIVKTILDGTIDPLAREVAGRWKLLFGNRGTLRLTSEGELSRDVQGETLSFGSFSTGEKMGAQLILRLMILDAATKATFCWIDEPLEHLDPDARRQVATMLAAMPRTTDLNQLLVTTYEEPLARRLAQRTSGDVDLVYVRAGDSDE